MAAGAQVAWTVPLAICCLLSILFLLASTIVLALIPVYLSTKHIQVDTNRGQENLMAGFASDVTDSAQLGTVNDPSDLSSQLFSQAGVSTTDNSLSNANFLSAEPAARRRRQSTSSNGKVNCETATGLPGDILLTAIVFKYPLFCFTSSCQNSYRTKFINSLRKNYQPYTVKINFTSIVKSATLKFCGIFSSDSSDCTSQTKNNGYAMDTSNNIYTFNPSTRNLSLIGNINCSTSSSLYGIAVQRTGTLWATFADGSLFKYNLASQTCSPTTFSANQSNITTFSMTFVKNPTDSGEVLYINSQGTNQSIIGKLDLNSLTITTVGDFNDSDAYSVLASPSDTGLYAVLQTTNYTFAEISKTNGSILYSIPLSLPLTNSTNSSYALAAYNNVFYFFEGSSNDTTLYTLDKTTGALAAVGTYNVTVYGSTISSCYGT